MKYVMLAGIGLGLAYLALQAGKYFVGHFMPKTADKIDTWREKRFVDETAQAILDGNQYIGWELQRYVGRRAPKPLPRPVDYGVMEGHPEMLEFEQGAAADRHTRIIDAINKITREEFARRNAA